MTELDPDDQRPPYVQVADAVRRQIESGDLGPGGKLPKHDQLVAEFEVSLNTVKRALGLLQDQGLIVSRRGEGAFVRTRPPQVGDGNGDDVRQAIAELARRVEILERKVGGR